MRRFLLPVVLLLAALVVQLTVFDRLPLPGGVAPDLVLLVVVALALNSGPMTGMICGFCAGLALDIAPPSGHLIGVYALVFCLLGYLCGMVSAELESSVLLPLAASAGGAAVARAYAAVGSCSATRTGRVPAVPPCCPCRCSTTCCSARSCCSAWRWPTGWPPGSRARPGYRAKRRRPGRRPGWARPRSRRGAPRGCASPRPGRETAGSAAGGWLAASAELARTRPTAVRLHLGGTRTAATPVRSKAAGTGWRGGPAAVRRHPHGGDSGRPALQRGGPAAVRRHPQAAANAARSKPAGGVARLRSAEPARPWRGAQVQGGRHGRRHGPVAVRRRPPR